MKKIGCIGHDCAACATREKHINKLKQDVERWKSRAATYKKQVEVMRAAASRERSERGRP